jgi:hypothetical protein
LPGRKAHIGGHTEKRRPPPFLVLTEERVMDQPTSAAAAQTVAQPVAIPVQQVIPWALFGALLAVLAYYFVGSEQGATSLIQGMGIHEWFHDARHLLGFPCH